MKKQQYITSNIIFLLIMLIPLQSCSPTKTPTPTIPPTTFTPSVTKEPTPTNCPYLTPIPLPSQPKPKVIYALLDKSGSYKKYTKAAIDVLINSLILSIEPGDKVYVVWLGEEEPPDEYLLYGNIPVLNTPVFTPPIPTLSPPPMATSTFIPTATNLPNTDLSELGEQVATQTAEAISANETATAVASYSTATQVVALQEQAVNNQTCLQMNTNIHNQNILNDYFTQRNDIIKNYVNQTLTPLLTPDVESYDSGTHIYNNLYIASKVIQTEQDKNPLASYYLLILSDMEDVGSNDGDELEVNLRNTNVLVAMLYCNESIQCQERTTYWQNYFLERGAILPFNPFRLIQETTPESIADFFKSNQ